MLQQRTLFTCICANNSLWTVNLQPPTQWANAATTISPPSSNTSELIQYLHACCFSPQKITWLQAIRNGHFTTWPGLTHNNLSKLLPPSIATALGHLDQQ
jgi:hypothetical protein